ncbi:MAG: transcription antitermination factor NusB, partial [Peptostreptococcaceae bacterium]|nr:transcription antitermination factor NusB [Peptostreptococcaceae bacterium]
KIDLAILRTAITEIKYVATPYKVAINEALELSKKFSDEKSTKFINGVLKDYVKIFEEEK